MSEFEWDLDKAVANLRKHRIAFEDSVRVFADPLAQFRKDRIDEGEQRWEILGLADYDLLLVVIHVIRSREGTDVTRIISARKAERHERRRYEEGNS